MRLRTFVVLLLCLFSSPPLLANDGPITSGGGDEVALEFARAFQTAQREILANHPDLAAMLQGQDLATTFARASLFVVDQQLTVEYQGVSQESVATNTPASGWILINRYRWKQIRQPRLREAVALHEIASLAGLEGTGRYPISSAYLGKFQFEPDPALILSGKNPRTDSAFSIQRRSCESNLVFKHRRTGKESKTTFRNLETEGSWNIRGTDYSITYFLSSSEDANEVPWLSRRNAVTVQSNGGIVSEMDSSLLFIDAKSARLQERAGHFGYFAQTNGGIQEVYSWENGVKGHLMSRVTAERLPDGGTRTVSRMAENAFPEGDYVDVGSANTCTAKELSREAWLTLVDDPDVAAEISQLDHLAFVANDAERKSLTCSPETCESLRAESALQEQAFVRAWSQLYSERKAAIEKKFETQRASWRKREERRVAEQRRARRTGVAPANPTYRRTPAEENASRAIEHNRRRNHMDKVEDELEDIRRELERIRRR